MLKAVSFVVAALVALAPALAQAQTEATIKRAIESKMAGVKVDGVAKTPYLGLYEVRIGNDIIYTDEKVSYVFVGHIRDGQSFQDLTEDRLAELSGITWKELPLADAVKTVRGNGTRQVAVFSDPNCPYCKRFESQLMGMSDVTIYTFLYPILSPDSMDKAKAIWCSKDRSRAYYDLMLKGVRPEASGTCSTPLDKNLALGRKLGVDGTPTSFVATGQRITGARFEMVQRALDAPAK